MRNQDNTRSQKKYKKKDNTPIFSKKTKNDSTPITTVLSVFFWDRIYWCHCEKYHILNIIIIILLLL